MVVAVLQQHCGIRLHAHDVFVSTVGGARLSEPASDLAIAVALASANAGTPAPAGRRRRWARSASPASCAGSATCPSGWPRPGRLGLPGRGGARATRASAAPAPTRRREVDGMQVIDAPDIASALRVLQLGGPASPAARNRSVTIRVRTSGRRSPRLTPLAGPNETGPTEGNGVVGTDRSDETLRLRATLASIAPAPPCATGSSGSCAAAPAP